MELIKALWKDEQGASMAEYALLMALIAVATIGAITALRDQIISIFNDATTTLSTASCSSAMQLKMRCMNLGSEIMTLFSLVCVVEYDRLLGFSQARFAFLAQRISANVQKL